MHAESERTVELLDGDMKVFNSELVDLQNLLKVLSQAKVQGDRIIAVFPALVTLTNNGQIPPRSVWPIAKSNGTAALLPENLAEIYTRLDYEADQFLAGQQELDRARDDTTAVAIRLNLSMKPGATFQMSRAEREELARAIAVHIGKMGHEMYYVAQWAGAADAVVHNVQSRDAMQPFMLDRIKALE